LSAKADQYFRHLELREAVGDHRPALRGVPEIAAASRCSAYRKVPTFSTTVSKKLECDFSGKNFSLTGFRGSSMALSKQFFEALRSDLLA